MSVSRAGDCSRGNQPADVALVRIDTAFAESPGLVPFTTHRVRLHSDRYTAAVGVDPELDIRTDIVVAECGGDLTGRSVIDLGCLEGGFALEFARRGANPVLGIEYREISVQRCELARDLMSLDGVEFIRGDITTDTPDGPFNVVYAAGILYHLAEPAHMLMRLGQICSGFMLLDTHVADPHFITHSCSDEIERPGLGDVPYRGRWFGEFDPDATLSERDEMLWASSTNPLSFWPYEADLCQMLNDAGFTRLQRVTVADPLRWQVDHTNRVLYVCRP